MLPFAVYNHPGTASNRCTTSNSNCCKFECTLQAIACMSWETTCQMLDDHVTWHNQWCSKKTAVQEQPHMGGASAAALPSCFWDLHFQPLPSLPIGIWMSTTSLTYAFVVSGSWLSIGRLICLGIILNIGDVWGITSFSRFASWRIAFRSRACKIAAC